MKQWIIKDRGDWGAGGAVFSQTTNQTVYVVWYVAACAVCILNNKYF